jgi:hypothetical protein
MPMDVFQQDKADAQSSPEINTISSLMPYEMQQGGHATNIHCPMIHSGRRIIRVEV